MTLLAFVSVQYTSSGRPLVSFERLLFSGIWESLSKLLLLYLVNAHYLKVLNDLLVFITDLQIDGAPAPMAHQITLWVQLKSIRWAKTPQLILVREWCLCYAAMLNTF